MNLLSKAIILATAVHDGQYRKGSGLPYITHPLSVMTRLRHKIEKDVDNDILICAVLHDVYEDVDMKTFDMEAYCKHVNCENKRTIQEVVICLFGEKVHNILEELTNDKATIARIGKTAYLKAKLHVMSSAAFIVKCVDRLDNLSDSKHMTPEAREALIDNTIEIWDIKRQGETELECCFQSEVLDCCMDMSTIGCNQA